MKEFIKQCMMAVGTKASHASSLADVLVEGDLRGHYSHGLNRMGVYENHGPMNYHLAMPFLFYFNLIFNLLNHRNLSGIFISAFIKE